MNGQKYKRDIWEYFETLGLMLVLVLIATQVVAQPTVRKSDRYQRNFEELMKDPANPERSFQFAKVALEEGDLNGAISSFERILQINPRLDNIKLELGVLYLRVGSTVLATQYLKEAIDSPDIPNDVRNRAKRLYNIASDASSPHTFSVRIGLGAHHDSNANAAPSSRVVLVGGQTGLLDENDTGQSDVSASIQASLQYLYSFGNQEGDHLEVNLMEYSRRYDDLDEINVDALRFDIGPRFYLGPLISAKTSFRPYLAGSLTYLDSEKYQTNGQLGVDTSYFFDEFFKTTVKLVYDEQSFYNSDDRPYSDQRDGNGFSLDANIDYDFTPTFSGFLGIGASSRDAEVKYESRSLQNLLAGVSYSFKPPFQLPYRWSTSLTAVLTEVDYDAPDPAVSQDETREDSRDDIYWRTTMVFTQRYYSTIEVFKTKNDSTLPNYEYDNLGMNLVFWIAM
ncbi:hypothetical protein [Ketobacter sp.]|uniref:hypothetical protein n=1 Tax=Ketobacter sp. TaxID=2083498 RepID=UPI000F1DA65D|nr:hypothetical protein [Ketobacter sp.]RLU01760.1 MAG: hypothetical protein D9N14_01080 [Ketobacter sp.]